MENQLDLFPLIRAKVDEKIEVSTDWKWLSEDEKEIQRIKYTLDAVIEYLEHNLVNPNQ